METTGKRKETATGRERQKKKGLGRVLLAHLPTSSGFSRQTKCPELLTTSRDPYLQCLSLALPKAGGLCRWCVHKKSLVKKGGGGRCKAVHFNSRTFSRMDLLDVGSFAQDQVNRDLKVGKSIKGVMNSCAFVRKCNCFLKLWALQCQVGRAVLFHAFNHAVFLWRCKTDIDRDCG